MLDTMTLTKVVGAFCGALLVFLLGGWMGEALYHGGGHGAHEQAYVIDTGSEEATEEVVEEVDMVELVAAADAGAGERVFRACAACHKIDEPVNAVGPHLDGVMGREIASIGDFGYSGALPAGEVWTIENMSAWIENPSGFAEGTSMSYRGLADDEDRADLIAYMIAKSPDFSIDEAAADGAAAPDAAAAEVETASVDAAPETETAAAEAAAEEPAAPDAAETAEAAPDVSEDAAPDMAAADDAAEPAADTAARADASAAEPAEDAGTEVAAVAAPEAEPVEAAAVDTAAASPFMAAYETADAGAGERVYRQCQACHVADKEQNRVGPHLVDIVGRPIGSVDGFRYSGALPEGEWTLDNLNAWLENPRGFAKGTSMSYAGLRDMQDRANVIAYIESLN